MFMFLFAASEKASYVTAVRVAVDTTRVRLNFRYRVAAIA